MKIVFALAVVAFLGACQSANINESGNSTGASDSSSGSNYKPRPKRVSVQARG